MVWLQSMTRLTTRRRFTKTYLKSGTRHRKSYLRRLSPPTRKSGLIFNDKDGEGVQLTAEAIASRNAQDPDKNYFELMHKFEFDYQGERTAIVKYWLVKVSRRDILISRAMQKSGERWYFTTLLGFEWVKEVIRRLKPEVLRALIQLHPRPDFDPLVAELYEASRAGGHKLDFDATFAFLKEMVEAGREEELLQLIDSGRR